eukprot:3923323-Rhodomonas_salina.3
MSVHRFLMSGNRSCLSGSSLCRKQLARRATDLGGAGERPLEPGADGAADRRSLRSRLLPGVREDEDVVGSDAKYDVDHLHASV